MVKIRAIIKIGLLYIGSKLNNNCKSKILFYHDVYRTTNFKAKDADVCMGTHIDLFKKHIDVIKNEGYQIVPKITNPNNEVCIMFDDGFRGIWECRDFFYENGICPTIFLAVDLIGQDGFLKLEEIVELQNNGFHFECHSWSHTNLAAKTDDQLVKELGDSKKKLSELLNKEVSEICLPIGFFSNHLIDKLKEYGYKEVYSSIPGNFFEKIYGYMRPRILCQSSTPVEMKFLLRGGAGLLRRRYEKLHHLNNM